MNETQRSICDWGLETFGVSGSALTTATRMNVEVAELLTDLGGVVDPLLDDLLRANNALAEAISNRANALEREGLLPDRSPNGKECCDVQVILYQVAERCGLKLAEETDRKMAINRARTWRRLPTGRFQHT